MAAQSRMTLRTGSGRRARSISMAATAPSTTSTAVLKIHQADRVTTYHRKFAPSGVQELSQGPEAEADDPVDSC